MDDPRVVRVVLHPGGTGSNGIASRSWLRFHNRLPALLFPNADDRRGTVEVAGCPGDVLCIVVEDLAGRRGRTTSSISVVEVPTARCSSSSASLAHLPGIDRPVHLLAYLTGVSAGSFLRHLGDLERDGVELVEVRPAYWTRLSVAVESRVRTADLPWPDEEREVPS